MKKSIAASLIGAAIVLCVVGAAVAVEMPTNADIQETLCDRARDLVAEAKSNLLKELDETKLKQAGIDLGALTSQIDHELGEVVQAETGCSAT